MDSSVLGGESVSIPKRIYTSYRLTTGDGEHKVKQPNPRRTTLLAVVLIVVVIVVAAVAELYASGGGAQPGPGLEPNPCGEASGPHSNGWVLCKGFELTETGATCSLSAGSCTMTLINNDTSRYEVLTTECSVVLPIMINSSGITVMVVEAINGGPASSGVPRGSASAATCWFPTNKYMTNMTVDQGVNGCFTFAQAGNLTNTVGLCWIYGKWSATSGTNPPLDCPALLGNLDVSFPSVNVSVGYVAIKNANSYGIWLARVNGTATVGPLGIAVGGQYVGDWFAIPQNETVAARSNVTLNLAGTPNAGQLLSYTLSFLPTNETITYTQPCSVTYQGTIPTTSG